jgi:transcriptional regulator with XRE-family HTH domain
MAQNRTSSEDDILKQFGDWLKNLRRNSNISQEDLAERAGFSRSYYTEIETGRRNVSLLNLHKLAEALGIEVVDLLLRNSNKKTTQPRTASSTGFINESILIESGLTAEMIRSGIGYSYTILDAIDDTLLSGNAPRLARIVELANLSSMLGNLLGAGIAKASAGIFERNGPHKFPDLLAQESAAQDVEIKVALETNKPKGHLAKPGYYLTCRYVLCNADGKLIRGDDNRGEVVYIWEARFGYLDVTHFNISNTTGDSGKTAVINAAGMSRLNVVYCDLELSPYSPGSKSYKAYEDLLGL